MNQQRGIELWAKLAEAINEESVDGVIDRNCHRLWRGYLNKWTNAEWFDILTAVSELQEIEPDLFLKFHNTALTTAAEILVKEYRMNPRCLDTKENRADYWRLAMTLREVWNRTEQRLSTTPDLFEEQ